MAAAITWRVGAKRNNPFRRPNIHAWVTRTSQVVYGLARAMAEGPPSSGWGRPQTIPQKSGENVINKYSCDIEAAGVNERRTANIEQIDLIVTGRKFPPDFKMVSPRSTARVEDRTRTEPPSEQPGPAGFTGNIHRQYLRPFGRCANRRWG